MSVFLPAGVGGGRSHASEPLKLLNVQTERQGANARVTLVLDRALTRYEASVIWDVFPGASGSAGSSQITTVRMSLGKLRNSLAKDVTRISKLAVAREREHQRVFAKYKAAAEAVNRTLGKLHATHH